MNNDRLYITEENSKKELQIDNSKDIEISFAVPTPEQIGLALSDVSQHIDLVNTAYNQTQINDISNPNSYDKKGYRSNAIKAELRTNTETLTGSLKIESSVNSRQLSKHRAVFKTGNTIWTDIAKTTYINTLDLGQEHYTESRVAALIADDAPYNGIDKVWYSLKNYEKTTSIFALDDNQDKALILPDVYAKAIIDAFFELAGYSLNCDFFETEYFRRITHPLCQKLDKIIVDNSFVDLLISRLNCYGKTAVNSLTSIKFQIISLDNGNIDNTDPSLTSYFTKTGGIYSVKINYDVTTNTGNGQAPTFLILAIEVDGLVERDFSLINSGVNEIQMFIPKGKNVSFSYTNGGINSLEVEITPVIDIGKPIQELSIYQVSSVLEDVAFSDYIKGFIHANSLVISTDHDTKTVIAAPYSDVILPTGEFVKGFYYADHLAEDWSNKVMETQPVNYAEFDKRFLEFQFKKDNNDKSFLENDKPYSQTVDLGKGNPETAELVNAAFSATLNKLVNGIDMPSFVGDNDENNYSYNIRLLYKFGNQAGDFDFMTQGNTINTYPFSAQLSDINGINLTFEEHQSPSLISTFYSERIKLMKQKTTWIFDVEITNGTNKVELMRRKKYIKGQLYLMYKIERLNISKRKSVARCYFRKK